MRPEMTSRDPAKRQRTEELMRRTGEIREAILLAADDLAALTDELRAILNESRSDNGR